MYFTKVKIENYGSIKKFEYNFRFDSNENPVPLIIVGQNGTGKTLLLANLVDALIEFKRDVYGEHIYETEKNKFFKIGSQSYIRAGESFSHVLVETKNQGKTYKYIDIMSKQPKEDVENGKINRADLKNANIFFDNGFSKKIVGSLKTSDYKEFIQLYFPNDRYYNPMWYAPRKKEEMLAYEDDVSYPKSCLIKKNLIHEINNWLRDVYLEKVIQPQLMPNEPSLPENIRGKWVNLQMLTPLQELINAIFSTIQGVNSSVGDNISRKQKSISTASKNPCFDISQLSQGEINLFAIALSIVKEWDLINNNVRLNDIVGTVVIDEADLGLHIDYAYRALPTLMKLFPKIQFILTSHSPFFLSGLVKEYGENIDILMMPDGLKIIDISAFSEMKKAQDLFAESIEELRNRHEKLAKELTEIKSKNGKVLIYTEGETDVILMEKALSKLGITDLELEFITASTKDGKHSDSVLKTLLENLQANGEVQNSIVIGIFDRDAKDPIKFKCEDGVDKVVNNERFLKLGANLYAFAVPVPHNRPEINQISIEHYFTDDEIMRENEKGQRLFFGNEFNATGNHIDASKQYHYHNIKNLLGTIKIIEHETNNCVTDLQGNGDYSLSKKHFAEAIRDDRPNFNDFDFSEFNKIFDIVREIKKDILGE